MEIHPDMKGMGERIRMMREDVRGWTQSDLAERSGVDQPNISNYEGERRAGVPLAHVMRLADALGVPIQFLAYGREYRKVGVELLSETPNKVDAK